MSQWTHVSAIIRLDDLRAGSNKTIMLDELLSRIKKEIPTGSEGPLKFDYWINPHKSSVASYTISIFGDLRDYSDLEGIKKWFGSILDNLMVRQACLLAYEDRDGEKVLISYPGDMKIDTEPTDEIVKKYRER